MRHSTVEMEPSQAGLTADGPPHEFTTHIHQADGLTHQHLVPHLQARALHLLQ